MPVLLLWLQVSWNIFDSIIVAFSLLELFLQNVSGLYLAFQFVSATPSSPPNPTPTVAAVMIRASPRLHTRPAESVQAGQVVAVLPRVAEDDLDVASEAEERRSPPGHRGLPLLCGRHAAVPGEIRLQRLPHRRRLPASSLAHARLLPQLPHRLQGSVWAVGRVLVGLHGSCRPARVSGFLHGVGAHRKPAGNLRI